MDEDIYVPVYRRQSGRGLLHSRTLRAVFPPIPWRRAGNFRPFDGMGGAKKAGEGAILAINR